MAGGRRELSAGFVVFRCRKYCREYLLVRDVKHGNWGFPKGHVEPGESGLSAARREAREEAGLRRLRAVPGFRRRLRYRVPSGRMKTAVYFLARLPAGAGVTVCRREISAHHWLPLRKALKRLTFQNAREVLVRADRFLERRAGRG